MLFRVLLLFFVFFLQTVVLSAESSSGTLFFIGPANFNQHLASLLKLPSGGCKSSSLTNTAKHYLLPEASELLDCGVIVISPMTAVSPLARPVLTQFVEQGGKLVWLYDSIRRTWDAGGGLGFELTGFDGYLASHHEPYDQKTAKKHRLAYASKKWGDTPLAPFETVFCLFATDLIDAEAIIVDQDHPERALLCVSTQGKGNVFFCGTTSLFFPLIMSYCGIQ
ncbi:MAG: hypothetical protein WCT05_01920 [Lentisphaeria bacterium]